MTTLNSLELILNNKLFLPEILTKFKEEPISPFFFSHFLKNLTAQDMLNMQKTFNSGIWDEILTIPQRRELSKAFKNRLNLKTLPLLDFFKNVSSEWTCQILTLIPLYELSSLKTYKKLSLAQKQIVLREIFLKEEIISLSFIKIYEGDWNEFDHSGVPLFFKLEASDLRLATTIINNPSKFNLEIRSRRDKLNYLEFQIAIKDEAFSTAAIKKLLTSPALKDSQTLKIFTSPSLFKLRYLEEKHLYSPIVQSEVLIKMFDYSYPNSVNLNKYLLSHIKDFEISTNCVFLNLLNLRQLDKITASALETLHGAGISTESSKLLKFLNAQWLHWDNASLPSLEPKPYLALKKIVELNPNSSLLLEVSSSFSHLFKSLVQYKKHNSFPAPHLKKVLALLEKITFPTTSNFITTHPKWKKEILPNITNYPSEITKVLLESATLEELTKKILGTASGFALSQVKTYLITPKTINLDKIYWVYYLIKAGFNYDLVNTFIKSPTCERYSEFPNSALILGTLKTYVSENSIFKILTNRSFKFKAPFRSDLLEDIFSYLIVFSEEAFEVKVVKNLIKSSKNLHKLHDEFMNFDYENARQEHFPLAQEGIRDLHNFKLSSNNSSLSIKIPFHSEELVKIGKELNICVGNGEYSERVRDQEIFILTLIDSSQKTKYCIELAYFNVRSKPQIIQARGKSNCQMPNKFSDLLLKALIMK